MKFKDYITEDKGSITMSRNRWQNLVHTLHDERVFGYEVKNTATGVEITSSKPGILDKIKKIAKEHNYPFDVWKSPITESTVYIDKPDDLIKKIINATFPGYSGRKIQVVVGKLPTQLNSYWSGGSKDEYCFYNLANDKAKPVMSNHPQFERSQPRDLDPEALPDSVVLVKHTIFSGKDLGITIYAKTGAVAPLLTPPEDTTLSKEELFTMILIRSLKSFARREEASKYGVTPQRYEGAIKSLVSKGYVGKNGALSTTGKNYLASTEYARMDSMSAAKKLGLKSPYEWRN